MLVLIPEASRHARERRPPPVRQDSLPRLGPGLASLDTVVDSFVLSSQKAMSRSGRRCCISCPWQNAVRAASSPDDKEGRFAQTYHLSQARSTTASSCFRQAMTASIFRSSAIDRPESRSRWRGLATLLACPLPSLAAEWCCAARAPRVTMGWVRRLGSGVPKHIGPEVMIGCAGCPDETPSARHSSPADNCSRAAQPSGMPEARIDLSPGMLFSFLSSPDRRAIIGLYGPWFIAVSSKQAGLAG